MSSEAACDAGSDEEDELERFFVAAGFDDAPVVTMWGHIETSLSVAELREQLASLSSRPLQAPSGTADADAVHRLLTTGFHEDALLWKLCDTHTAPNGTLVVAFGGLVQGMGGMAKHEFVATCERAGASALFVRGLT